MVIGSAFRVQGLSRRATLARLEWVGIIGPLVFLVLYHYLLRGPLHGLLESNLGLALLLLILGMGIVAFSRVMFRAVTHLQRNVEILSRTADLQNAQLRALNEANLALAQERLVSPVLQRVVDLSRELVGARYAALSILGEHGEVRAFLTSGLDAETRQRMGPPPVGKGLLGHIPRLTEPLRLDRIADHPASVGFPPGHPPMSTFLGVPIRDHEHAVGSLYLTEKLGGGAFTREDEEVVELFANQAAVALQNANLNERLQAVAVETERQRISREMHDGLAQVLGYVNTKAQAVDAFLANGDMVEARKQVQELGQAARKVYQDVREGILSLHAQMGMDRTLAEVLDEFLAEYRHQVHARVEVAWTVRPDEMSLTTLQEVQILRIIQEALSNVRKHAEATAVRLAIQRHGDALEVVIEDNGKGFNPLAIERGEWPHLGLQSMQERADAVGGGFSLDSTPGRGTKVTVTVPHAVVARSAGGAP